MHQCLGIREILSRIAENLRDRRFEGRPGMEDEYITQHTADLAVLARTCRTFHGPAVRLLWDVQYTSDNLMRTLPSETWDVRRPHELSPDELVSLWFMSSIGCLLIWPIRCSQGQSRNTNGSVLIIMLHSSGLSTSPLHWWTTCRGLKKSSPPCTFTATRYARTFSPI